MAYLTDIATQWGISIWLLAIILIWTAIWKLLALWKSARNGHVAWFIVLAIFNTVGILPILYIYVFSKMGGKAKVKKSTRKITKGSKIKSLALSPKKG